MSAATAHFFSSLRSSVAHHLSSSSSKSWSTRTIGLVFSEPLQSETARKTLGLLSSVWQLASCGFLLSRQWAKWLRLAWKYPGLSRLRVDARLSFHIFVCPMADSQKLRPSTRRKQGLWARDQCRIGFTLASQRECEPVPQLHPSHFRAHSLCSVTSITATIENTGAILERLWRMSGGSSSVMAG